NQENNQQKINEVYTDTIFSKSLLLLISALASLILVLSVKPLNNVSSLIIVGYISVIGSVLFPIWLFQGLQIMKGVVITTTTAKIISICLIFVLVHDQHDTFYAMFATSLGVGISGIISLWYVRKLGKVCFEKMDVSRAYKLTKEAYPIFLSFIGSSVYTTLNSFILSFFGPVAAIGIYS
ncbi:oligosaccharide flippase family protein, partial [Klebsiella pneumoniae]|uniref:oligosaccharide flippase family protein n=1 Tax=Klebsiella pneumoniae TaxID=573 RepID=UPI0013D5043B